MKQVFALVLSYLVVLSGLCAQSRNTPTAPRGNQAIVEDLERVGRSSVGYLGLKWGSSADRLTELYPECKEITDEIDRKRGIQRYIEEIEDGGIEARQFVYSQDRLYQVYVLYGYVDDETTAAMKAKLESIYGRTFTSATRDVYSDDVLFNIVDWYMDFSRDLQIVFTTADVYDDRSYKLGTTMTCLYVNRELKNEAERPKLFIRPVGDLDL